MTKRSNVFPPLLFFMGLLASVIWPAAVIADGDSDDEVEYSRRGADTCLGCHEEPEILSIFRTPHAQSSDPDTPFANLQCEGCHGAGGNHAARIRRNEVRPPITNFGHKETQTPIAEQNAICANCHVAEPGPGWHGSVHENESLSCADCHQVHAPADRALMRAEQAEVCYTCHATQRAQSFKASSHPIRENKMACTSCHNPHTSSADHLLARDNVNQVCYGCHAETRGPFLWEHAPVAEDCTSCHDPHGSNHPLLLTRRPPQLCQQCHSQAGHPSIGFTDAGLASGSPSPYLVGGSCMNCHPMVHGTNHPSGVRLSR